VPQTRRSAEGRYAGGLADRFAAPRSVPRRDLTSAINVSEANQSDAIVGVAGPGATTRSMAQQRAHSGLHALRAPPPCSSHTSARMLSLHLPAAATHSELHLPAAATQAHEYSLSTSLQQPHKRTNALSPPPCSSHTSARILSLHLPAAATHLELHLPAAATQAHEYSLSTSLQQPRT